MRSIDLTGTWLIKAPRDKVYAIVSDFERMPERFPKVAESLRITWRDGNRLEIDAVAKSFGRRIPVKMRTELRPPVGFTSDNRSELGTKGHEEFLMEEVPEGTLINYRYQVELLNPVLRWLAKPLIGWYAMRLWKKAFIDQLKKIVET
jgi:carbon monoxide dehydrogenase subunit G